MSNVHLTKEEETKLRELVAKSHRGLKKLQVTYIKDTAVYSQIQVLIDETKRTDYPGREISRLVQNKWNDNFVNEIKSGSKEFDRLRQEGSEHLIEETGKKLRDMMSWMQDSKLVDEKIK
mgnify:CR=1 FL=1